MSKASEIKVGQQIPTSALPAEIVRNGGGWIDGKPVSVYVLRDSRTGQFLVAEVRATQAWMRSNS